MVDTKIEAQKLARAAAQGVAIALKAREQAPIRGSFQIICGIPTALFEVTINADQGGGFSVGPMRPAPGQ